MSLPYFPMYPADFEADTSHLTLEEDGAYNRLLRLMWMTPGCSLPDDNAWIARRMRADADAFQRVVLPVIEEFFRREKGRLFSPRLRKEALLSEQAHQRRVDAGRKGGAAGKALKTKETWASNAEAKPKQPEPEPEVRKKEAKASMQKRGSRLPADWFLPAAWGEWATAEGFSESFVRDQAERFRDYWHAAPAARGVKADWLATWRTWMRNARDRQPQLKAITGGRNDRAQFAVAHREYTRRIAAGEVNRGPDPSDPFGGR